MNTVCVQCKGEFEARAGAKYCSPKCRVAYSRATETPQAPVETVAVTPKVKVPTPVKEAPEAIQSDTCEYIEHPADGCLACARARETRKDATCGERYIDCVKWGICIESYHRGMCMKELQ